MQNFTRRELLKLGAATTVAELASLGLHGCGGSITSPSVPSVPSACSKLTDIEHVVILIQENRSFDHYFGAMPGVRGFADPGARGVLFQPGYPVSGYEDHLLPFHLETGGAPQCFPDITHDWVPQHESWDAGEMDGFVRAHL